MAEQGSGPLDSSSFVMVPFFSWLERDDFLFGTRHVKLEPSGFGFERSLLGLGWTSAWTVDDLSEAAVTLSHRNEGGPWPWRYHAQQTLSLTAERLRIRVKLHNLDSTPMPAGIGLHTFFPRTPGLKVQANLKALHLMSEQGLPYGVSKDHPALPMFANGDELKTGLDNVFEGWDGTFTITANNGDRLRVQASSPYDFLCVNAPHDANYCCIEPVTHTTNALHRSTLPDGHTGFVLLEPGATMTATADFFPEKAR